MCVILSCEKAKPSLKMLEKAQKTNPDGAGIAWIENHRVYYRKGTDLKAKEIHKMIQNLPLPFVIHFRIQTTGGAIPGLCHPFIIHKDSPNPLKGVANSVLFHNGHWTDWKHYMLETACRKMVPYPEGSWSDTRAMAWLAGILGHTVFELTDEKTVVLTKDGPKYTGEGWVKLQNIICSNDLFDTSYEFDDVKEVPKWSKKSTKGYATDYYAYRYSDTGYAYDREYVIPSKKSFTKGNRKPYDMAREDACYKTC